MNPEDRPLLLIVEDNAIALQALTQLVSSSGWRVLQARSGFEAAAHLNSGAEPPEAVLVDLMIPDPPGEEIVRLIRDMDIRRRRDGEPVRVVAYTALDAPSDDGGGHPINQAFQAGVDAVILKPSTVEHTLAVIRGDHEGDFTAPHLTKGTP